GWLWRTSPIAEEICALVNESAKQAALQERVIDDTRALRHIYATATRLPPSNSPGPRRLSSELTTASRGPGNSRRASSNHVLPAASRRCGRSRRKFLNSAPAPQSRRVSSMPHGGKPDPRN